MTHTCVPYDIRIFNISAIVKRSWL